MFLSCRRYPYNETREQRVKYKAEFNEQYPEYRQLHYELCYHRPIEECIERGWLRFEAGAQGQHKLKRGLMPHATYSLHWLRHPGLASAVQEALHEQNAAMPDIMGRLSAHGPFVRG